MSALLLRVQHEAGGATFGEVGEEVVRHYGDPAGEYESIRTAAAIVERSDLTQIRMWGRDPVRMLNGLITNDLAQLSPTRAVYAALLTPKGRMISDVRAVASGRDGSGELLVDIPAAAASGVAEHLKKYVPPLFARWEMLGERLGVIGVYGPAAGVLIGELLDLEPPLEEDEVGRAGVGDSEIRVVGTRATGGALGFDLFVPADEMSSVWNALEAGGGGRRARPAGFAAFETCRVEAGRPRYGAEMTAESLPGEVYDSTGGMDRAISFKKGCYTGQEVVVRIAHRGHVNRNLRGLLMGDLPAVGQRQSLFAEESGKEIGWTTTSLHSPLMDQSIALCFVRREIQPGDRVRLGSADGPAAEVAGLPFASEAEV